MAGSSGAGSEAPPSRGPGTGPPVASGADPHPLQRHAPGDPRWHHQRPPGGGTRFGTAFALVLVFAALEAGVGVWSQSLALLSDALHMATDAMALALAAVAQRLAARPASTRYSFGYERAETLAGFVNALAMLPLLAWIAWEAVARLLEPPPIRAGAALAVAVVGLGVNLVLLRVLGHGQGRDPGHRLNRRGAVLHVIGDLAASAAAVLALGVAWATGWTRLDPLLSLAIALVLLLPSLRLAAQAARVLMDAVPPGVDLEAVGRALESVPGVASVHDLHVWHMTAERPALSAHLVLHDGARWPAVLAAARGLLAERFGIEHATLQPEAGQPPLPPRRSQLSQRPGAIGRRLV